MLRPYLASGISKATAARATAPAEPTVSADDGGSGAGDGVVNGSGIEGVAAVTGAAVAAKASVEGACEHASSGSRYRPSSSGEFEAGDGTCAGEDRAWSAAAVAPAPANIGPWHAHGKRRQ